MSIHINRNASLDGKEGVINNSIHYMPCQIHSDGEANVSKYFKPCISKQDGNDDVLCSSFRGYPLMGKIVPLPNGYRGIVAQETVKPMTEGAERSIHVTHTFKSFTYWNWDKPPSLNDALLSALDWIDVSEVLHSTTDAS
ncbi:ribonuclease H2 subunit C isoform X2 [Zootermopsis nevadensis]|uniref:Ribonuclease H2 subunit C n=1 Tax=Zootermopsis nevadensis TaxID=136037 RepID=A0A067QMW0_ZOONE|nr:ribonuclease H2 subunit C isoform X2 [Zootermopsis nevadensis]KDR10639.1 Ribonuclease H2 subunit C [Zootermopsis nevadensis]